MTPKQLIAAGLVGAVALFGASAGCDVPLSAKVVEVTNRCSADSDCGAEARCIEKTCVTTDADLANLVIEIDVPASSSLAPNTTHVISPRHEDLVLSGQSDGFYEFKDLILTELVDLLVTLEIENIPAACGALGDENGDVPIRVELSPTRAAFGAIPPGVSTRIYDAVTQEEGLTNEVRMSVPSGAYDIYITPVVPGDPLDPEDPYFDCFLPPRLLRDRSITDGIIDDRVVYDELKPTVDGSVSGFDLDGWTVALIENKRGRLMSEAEILTLSEQQTADEFHLSYWVENDAEDLDLVLRLTPPATRAVTHGLPVFYWKLSGLPGNAANIEKLADVTAIPVSGTVVDASYNVTVPSILTIHSNELFLDFGENVVYRRTIETDADGGFGDISLLPGDYTVIIQPVQGDALAVTKRSLILKQGNQGQGVTLPVMRKRPLDGRALTAQGAGASRINAVLEPTVPAAATFLQNVKQIIPIPPSSASTLTDSSGGFSLYVDPGTFNLSLRPAPSSDLPWTVVSSYFIDETETALDDVQLGIPNPVILIGQVSLNSKSIANARIRAWLRPSPMDSANPTPEPNAVQIAETTTLANGTYRLLLPGSLASIAR